ncbi:telomere maintenance protein, partial [Favolaschia claudopus]
TIPPTPTNDDIEAVIQMATAAAQNDPRHTLPLRDTRTQLFVANLPYRVRWQDLKDLFRRAGTVLRADVSLGPDNRSRGYGTVLLATAEDAGRAVDMFSGYNWQGRTLEVRADRVRDFDQPFPEEEEFVSPAGKNLFVGNLPFHVQWQDLKDLFRQAGTILRADIALGPDGRSRGFGTVVFATEKDARRAVGMFSGYEYNGRTLKVHYDKFSPATGPFDTNPNPFDNMSMGLLASLGLTPSHSLSGSPAFDPLGQSPQLAPSPLFQSQSAFDSGLTLGSSTLGRGLPTPPPSAGSGSPSPAHLAPATYARAASPSAGISARRSPTSPHSHPHPHHPGPIALPPPSFAAVTSEHNTSSPGMGIVDMQPPYGQYPPQGVHPAFLPPAYALTPLGLPPITPSMPPFSFLPMPSPQHQVPVGGGGAPGGYFGISPVAVGPMTPTGVAHYLNMSPLATPTTPHFPGYAIASPPPNGMGGGAMMNMGAGVMGLGPPSALSPGAFWGRAGEGTVYGAPVGQPPPQPQAMPAISPYAVPYAGGSPGFFGMHAMQEPKGYFDFAPTWGTGEGASDVSGVEKEIMKDASELSSMGDAVRDREERGRVDDDVKSDAGEAAAEQAHAPPVGMSKQRRSSDPSTPQTPLREGGRRAPPPPLRLPSSTSTGST